MEQARRLKWSTASWRRICSKAWAASHVSHRFVQKATWRTVSIVRCWPRTCIGFVRCARRHWLCGDKCVFIFSLSGSSACDSSVRTLEEKCLSRVTHRKRFHSLGRPSASRSAAPNDQKRPLATWFARAHATRLPDTLLNLCSAHHWKQYCPYVERVRVCPRYLHPFADLNNLAIN